MTRPPFHRTLAGAGAIDLHMTCDDEPRIELVSPTGMRTIWRPMSLEDLELAAQDLADLAQCARYGGGRQ